MNYARADEREGLLRSGGAAFEAIADADHCFDVAQPLLIERRMLAVKNRKSLTERCYIRLNSG
jgi:hypothetical protein